MYERIVSYIALYAPLRAQGEMIHKGKVTDDVKYDRCLTFLTDIYIIVKMKRKQP